VNSVGVLALQGGFDPHLRRLRALGVDAAPVKTLAEIAARQALVIPGGESTTMGKLLELHGLFEPLRELLSGGFPVLGTCAGLILLAKAAVGRDQPLLGVLDVDVARNAYGRQTESFETAFPFESLSGTVSLPAVFIRAPQIVRVGAGVRVLASYEGRPVCVHQNNVLAASFHPELTDATAVHDYFLSLG
jgi:pyridoxal 5'-phosphate synthase pdxT subunit